MWGDVGRCGEIRGDTGRCGERRELAPRLLPRHEGWGSGSPTLNPNSNPNPHPHPHPNPNLSQTCLASCAARRAASSVARVAKGVVLGEAGGSRRESEPG